MSSCSPDISEVLSNAIALHNQGELAKAEAIYESILRTDTHNSYCLQLLGIVAGQQKNNERAVELISRAISLAPNNEVFYRNRGIALLGLGKLESALADYEQAIALNPGYVDAYVYRGVTFQALNKPYFALESHDIALSLDPGNAEAHSKRAYTLFKLGLYREAVAGYEQAIKISPSLIEAHSNRGVALKELGLLDAALESYSKALAIDPGYAEANSHKATVLLLRGEMRSGWEGYESRWNKEANLHWSRNFEAQLWHGGQELHGKTILLHSEQGYGDTIQFCRYAWLVSQVGADVILEVPSDLHSLFQGLQGVNKLIVRGSEIPNHDFQCPLLSLPRAFGTTLNSIPAQTPYLYAKEADIREWSRILGSKHGARVGLVWRGSPAHKNDKNRSVRPEHFLEHLPNGFAYYALQKELSDHEVQMINAMPSLSDYRTRLVDFSQTAALCHLMDIVITVDTSVAHLSAALGKQTWLLLPFMPDWRWMLYRDDSPWYPTMRLFRQETAGDWVSVLKRVMREMSATFA